MAEWEMRILLAALIAFSPKACQKFCHKQGYDFCVPIRRDQKAYYCADRVEKSGVWEKHWTTHWAAQEPEGEDLDAL